ncbi:SGNH/GDSL hydrolase family protein [Teichococcus oryzae]|uniref:SGNH/GDSL hydrolase family protein n=1 Tax=Teichococcus oryzae TaxID=1608942 RepID=UPI0018831AAB|nr:SGNH/GDSL hydrolase family protein [Pseudoroseomonas oryzae]
MSSFSVTLFLIMSDTFGVAVPMWWRNSASACQSVGGRRSGPKAVLSRLMCPSNLTGYRPRPPTLVISAGGNDAGRQEGVLGEAVRSVAEGLGRIAAIRESFAREYRAMLDKAAGLDLPLAVCTIYDPRFSNPARRQVTLVALAAFNDVITREAFARGLAVIDLRLVCDQDADFASPTGPSVQGGGKIAVAVARWATSPDPLRRRSEVFASGGSSDR